MNRNKIIILWLIITAILGQGLISFADSTNQSTSIIVINGLPVKKVMSDIEGTELVTLSENESLSYRLLITKKDKRFIWTSRGNKELLFNQTGNFYDFVEPNGLGYIRVSIIDGKCLYMEHLTLAFKNITYWGIAEECNIKEVVLSKVNESC